MVVFAVERRLHHARGVEPVHVLHVERMKGGATHPAYAEDPTWNAWLADVFRGRHITRRTDRDNVGRNSAGAHKLLVKDVFATGLLSAPAAQGVSKLLVMRHPLAVALSKQAHRHWHWLWSTQEFLDQPGWRDGVLSPWVDMLTKVDREGTEMERLVAVWAVIQRISDVVVGRGFVRDPLRARREGPVGRG